MCSEQLKATIARRPSAGRHETGRQMMSKGLFTAVQLPRVAPLCGRQRQTHTDKKTDRSRIMCSEQLNATRRASFPGCARSTATVRLATPDPHEEDRQGLAISDTSGPAMRRSTRGGPEGSSHPTSPPSTLYPMRAPQCT